MQNLDHTHKIKQITQAISEKPDGILEALASEYAVPVQTVIECVPGGVTRIDGRHFIDVLTDIAGWGAITLICHSKDAVVEFSGPFPQGRIGHGMYNLQGGGIGLSGHLRPENCKSIFFARRPFMGMETLSIQFFNSDGETIFKIYVGRDEQRRLKVDQIQRFDQLEQRFTDKVGNA